MIRPQTPDLVVMALTRPRYGGRPRWGFILQTRSSGGEKRMAMFSSQALPAESQPTGPPSSPLFLLRPRSQLHLLLDARARRPVALAENAWHLSPDAQQPRVLRHSLLRARAKPGASRKLARGEPAISRVLCPRDLTVIGAVTIYLRRWLPSASSDLPEGWTSSLNALYQVLLRVGFTWPTGLPAAGGLLPPPFHLHRSWICGCVFSVALSLGSRPPGVTRHSALWSSDFPRRDCSRRGHLADSPLIV